MTRPRPRILSIGADATVLASCNLVLESAGFEVSGCLDEVDVAANFIDEPFDAILLGDALGARRRMELLHKFKAQRPSMPVIVMHVVGERGRDVEEADGACESLDGPERLINLVCSVLRIPPQATNKLSHRPASHG